MTSASSLRLTIIGFGEVGQILAADLHQQRLAGLSAWDRLFSARGSGPSRAARATAYIREARSMADAVTGCTVVISAVTAGECVACVREASHSLAPGAYYLDLNSVAPGTKSEAARLVETAGGRYVEAAVMSPIGLRRSRSPIWLGGPHAREFLPLVASLGFSGAAVFSDTIGGASAVKMCRSVVIKGLEALLTESLVAARFYGVDEAILASLIDLAPAENWTNLARYMVSRSLQHGRRRAGEMREAARTVVDAGVEPWMSCACAERQDWAGHQSAALRNDALPQILDALLAACEARHAVGANATVIAP
jgi:3-hydroxyisobutyrate dehydrogenase-like beta-hydroxyacid dehydrogenase